MNKLNDILSKIDELQAQIDEHGKLDSDLAKQIQYKFRLDWNYFSNAMEGNSLTRIETKQLMMDNVTIDGKSFKDISEMRGHDEVVQEIFKIGKGDIRISEKRIKNMHKAIMHEDDPAKRDFIGKWKTTDNHLINYRGEKFYFLPHSEVPDAMHELLNETNADIDALKSGKKDRKHPVLIAFDFHLKYVRIHPFYDGNGRTARLLTNLLLISFGYPPFLLSEKSRESYNRILAEIQGYGGDSKDFHVLLGNLLIESQQLVLDVIAGKDISDDDDIDKEILLWKQGLSNEVSELEEKSEIVVVQTYRNSVRPLFELFINKHSQFSDLFQTYEEHNLLGDQWWEADNLAYFDAWADQVVEDQAVNDVPSSFKSLFKKKKANNFFDFDGVGSVDRLKLELRYLKFKKAGVNTFDAISSLEVIFNDYSYIVKGGNSLVQPVEKMYQEVVSKDEMLEVVNSQTKAFLQELKRNVT